MCIRDRTCCCKRFLGEFAPVTIKMARDQSLSLNQNKISGTCGRLMCCLKYEQNVYEEKLKKIPPCGTYVITNEGKGCLLYTSSKAKEDFPLPLRPVKTTILSLGISKSIFFKLFAFAPLILIVFLDI